MIQNVDRQVWNIFVTLWGKLSLGANVSTRGTLPTPGVNQSDRSKNPADGLGLKKATVKKVAGCTHFFIKPHEPAEKMVGWKRHLYHIFQTIAHNWSRVLIQCMVFSMHGKNYCTQHTLTNARFISSQRSMYHT
ncbi:hypothetical protein ISCGN_009498 [Ixodes scapularis]